MTIFLPNINPARYRLNMPSGQVISEAKREYHANLPFFLRIAIIDAGIPITNTVSEIRAI